MSSLILNPSNSGSGSVTLNIFGDDTEYNINLPKTNGTLVSSVNGKGANNNGSVTIDVGVKSVNGVAPDSKGNVAVKVQSVATSDEVVAGTDNTKMMTPLRTKESVQQFSPTDYVTGLSVSGQTVTFTKKNGTTGKITTQDTKYTHPNSGVTAGTYNTVTVNAQGHVTGGNNVNYTKSVDGATPDGGGNVGLGLHSVARSGNYNELNNRPNLHAVATNGDYNSLNNKPYIPQSLGKPNVGVVQITSTSVESGFRFTVPKNGTLVLGIAVSTEHVHMRASINGIELKLSMYSPTSVRLGDLSTTIPVKAGDVIYLYSPSKSCMADPFILISSEN